MFVAGARRRASGLPTKDLAAAVRAVVAARSRGWSRERKRKIGRWETKAGVQAREGGGLSCEAHAGAREEGEGGRPGRGWRRRTDLRLRRLVGVESGEPGTGRESLGFRSSG
jgi:hypothetical protein